MLIVLLYANSFAQSNTDTNAVNGDILKKRPIAFQFSIGNDLTLRNFGNFNISGKKQFSKDFGVRLSIGFNYGNEDLEGSGVDGGSFGISIKETDNLFYSELDLLFYVNPNDIVKGYVGFGPYFGYFRYSRDRDYNYVQSNDSYYTFREYTTLGAGLLLGAEWFFTSKFSLFTEYNFLFTYSWIKETVIYDDYYYGYDSYNITGSDVSLRGEYLKFGLAAYF